MASSIDTLEIVDNNKVEDEYINTDIKLRLYQAIQKLDADTR